MNRKIRAIVKRPHEPIGHQIFIDNDLKTFQDVVGGYIEAVTICSDLVILCNEDGIHQRLPFNCNLFGHDFFGTLVFVGAKGDDFADYPGDFDHYKRCIIGGDL